MNNINVTTLPNGLRVICDPVPSVESVAVGIWLSVGARDEARSNNGVAHMVEHMLFKGTTQRDAAEIAAVIEDVGGHMNAYTGREMTSYHVHLLKDDLSLALDVLSDMVLNSTMPREEIERERGVILQEIGMCYDTPDDIIFDHYFETAYSGQSMGAPILGRIKTIENMPRDTLMGFVEQFYTPQNMVISVCGNFDPCDFMPLVEEKFGCLEKGTNSVKTSADYTGGEYREERNLEQSHIILGFRGVGQNHDDYYAAQILSGALGGGMSSRLFQEIREKRGLVYSIYSFHSSYSDGGQFGIYAGTGPEQLSALIPIMCDEILKIGDTITPQELERSKAQLRSSTLIAREQMMGRADQNAKNLILCHEIPDMADIVDFIDAVSVQDIKRLAQSIFSSRPTCVSLGPLDHMESFETLQGRFAA